jgi:hypothetical protein
LRTLILERSWARARHNRASGWAPRGYRVQASGLLPQAFNKKHGDGECRDQEDVLRSRQVEVEHEDGKQHGWRLAFHEVT